MHTIIITLQPVTVNRMREERAEASRAESVSALLHADPHVLRAIPASAARAPASARGLHTTHYTAISVAKHKQHNSFISSCEQKRLFTDCVARLFLQTLVGVDKTVFSRRAVSLCCVSDAE